MRTLCDSPSLVFQGLAQLHLGNEAASEASYIKATQVDGSQILAWQGLEKLYTKNAQWPALVNVYTHLADLALAADDAAKCGNALTKIVSIEREHGSRETLADALMAFVPGSRYFGLLETLPVPDQTAPASNPAFNAQMLMHAAALDNAQELAELYEQLDQAAIDDAIKKQKSTLEGAKLGVSLMRDQVVTDVLKKSRVPHLLELIRNHPRTDDKLRRDVEAKLLRHFAELAKAVPTEGPSANVGLKQAVRQQTLEFARGFVVLQVPDELAWTIYLDWNDFVLRELPYAQLVDYVRLFPDAPRTYSIRALLCLVDDEAYKNTDSGAATRERVHQETELLQLALDGMEKSKDSLFAQRVVSLFYLLDKDYASAHEVLEGAQKRLAKLAATTGAPFRAVEIELQTQLATALTHLHPPKHHKEARKLVDAVLAHQGMNSDARLALAYLDAAHAQWAAAKHNFALVMRLADEDAEAMRDAPQNVGRNLAALSLSPDARLEAHAELAWCLVQLGELDGARGMLDELIAHNDGDDNVFGADFRARLWWQLGRCYWAMGGEWRHDAQYAYHCYIVAIQRSGSFAPAFTALGEYYETEVSPPDLVRASKCFQKAFEMDAREYGAARRLVEHFANQREWDLVDAIARRVVEAEGGVDALAGRPQAGVHVSANAWVWKAIGIVEALRHRPERAIVALQVTLRSDPDDVDAWVRMGEAYLAFGRPIPALKTFARALQLLRTQPTSGVAAWHVLFHVADAQRRLGRFALATRILTRIVHGHDAQPAVQAVLAETRLDEARSLLAAGYVHRAHAALVASMYDASDALHADKLLTTAWKVAGDACFLLSKLDALRAAETEVVPPAGASEGLRSVLYSLVLLLGQLDVDARLAAIDAASAADLANDVPAASDRTALDAAGYATHAVLCYKYVALAHTTESKTAVFAWADLAMGLARLATALRTADAERSALAHEQAVQCVRLALARKSQARLWMLLGNLFFEEDVGTAQHAYIMAIETGAKSPAPWTNLGFLYLRQNDAELAEQAFVRAQTMAPDWPASWLGRALLLAQHSPDLRARLSLFEHAYMLSEGASLEADYGFALAAFARLAHAARAAPSRVLAPLLAANHYVAREPLDDAALHLSALLAEQLGASRLAIERIERATAQLEAEFEATESAALALKYGLASMNLGRIRLARRDASGAIEAFEGALALLDDDETPADDDALPARHTQLVHARVTATIGIAHAHCLSDDPAGGAQQLADVQQTLATSGLPADTAAQVRAQIAVLLARVLWRDGDRASIAAHLDAALAEAPTDTLLITTRAAVAAAAGDTAQYNAVLAQYAAALPDALRVQLRNYEPTAKLSIWQLAAAVRLLPTHPVPARCPAAAPRQHARQPRYHAGRARAGRRHARAPRGGACHARSAAPARCAAARRRVRAGRRARHAACRRDAPRRPRALEYGARRARACRARHAARADVCAAAARRGRPACRERGAGQWRCACGCACRRARAAARARAPVAHRGAVARGARRALCAVACCAAPYARGGARS